MSEAAELTEAARAIRTVKTKLGSGPEGRASNAKGPHNQLGPRLAIGVKWRAAKRKSLLTSSARIGCGLTPGAQRPFHQAVCHAEAPATVYTLGNHDFLYQERRLRTNVLINNRSWEIPGTVGTSLGTSRPEHSRTGRANFGG